LTDVTQAIQLDSKHAIAHYTRGQIREKLGHRDQAAADYRRALALDATYPEPAEALKRLEAADKPPAQRQPSQSTLRP
jgi:predicted TPR repeat methyltransferase